MLMRIFTKISLKKLLFTNTHSTAFQVVRTNFVDCPCSTTKSYKNKNSNLAHSFFSPSN